MAKQPLSGPDGGSLDSHSGFVSRSGFRVDAKGKLTSPATVALSSGNDAIDSGAVKLANAGVYLPGSLNCVAQAACAEFKIKFELRDNPLLRLSNFRLPAISARAIAGRTG